MVLVLEVRGVEVLVTGAGCSAGTGGATSGPGTGGNTPRYICTCAPRNTFYIIIRKR